MHIIIQWIIQVILLSVIFYTDSLSVDCRSVHSYRILPHGETWDQDLHTRPFSGNTYWNMSHHLHILVDTFHCRTLDNHLNLHLKMEKGCNLDGCPNISLRFRLLNSLREAYWADIFVPFPLEFLHPEGMVQILPTRNPVHWDSGVSVFPQLKANRKLCFCFCFNSRSGDSKLIPTMI